MEHQASGKELKNTDSSASKSQINKATSKEELQDNMPSEVLNLQNITNTFEESKVSQSVIPASQPNESNEPTLEQKDENHNITPGTTVENTADTTPIKKQSTSQLGPANNTSQSKAKLMSGSIDGVGAPMASTARQETVAETNRQQHDSMMQASAQTPVGGQFHDENWTGNFDYYTPDDSMFYRTNMSQGGWKGFGQSISPEKKKMFNHMKSGLGSSLGGGRAQTKMMQVVAENREVLDEYNQMQARIKKLSDERDNAMRNISMLERRQQQQGDLNDEKDMRYTTMTDHRQYTNDTENNNRRLFNDRRHSDFNSMQKSRYDLRGRNRSNVVNIKVQQQKIAECINNNRMKSLQENQLRFEKIRDGQNRAKSNNRTQSDLNIYNTSNKYNKKIDDISDHSKFIKETKKKLEQDEAQLVASLQQTKANEFHMAKVLKGLQMKTPSKTYTNLEAKLSLKQNFDKRKSSFSMTGTRSPSLRRKQRVKTLEEIKHEGGIHNFFECTYDMQLVIFHMIKDNQSFLAESELYMQNSSLFNNHCQQVSNFARQFDSNLYLMMINDNARKEVIKEIPQMSQNISYVIKDLWPKLGFLPIDETNPGTALIAEYFLNELVIADPESTDLENLQMKQMIDLFSGIQDRSMSAQGQ